MKYSKIKHTNDIKVIGHYPTLHKSCYNVNSGEFPDFEPNVRLMLHNKSKRTNFIYKTSALTFGIVVDKKFKNERSSKE